MMLLGCCYMRENSIMERSMAKVASILKRVECCLVKESINLGNCVVKERSIIPMAYCNMKAR